MIENNNFKIHKKGNSIYLRNNDDLLNTLTDKWINDKLKDTEKIMKRYYRTYNEVDPTFGEIIRLISKDLGVSI